MPKNYGIQITDPYLKKRVVFAHNNTQTTFPWGWLIGFLLLITLIGAGYYIYYPEIQAYLEEVSTPENPAPNQPIIPGEMPATQVAENSSASEQPEPFKSVEPETVPPINLPVLSDESSEETEAPEKTKEKVEKEATDQTPVESEAPPAPEKTPEQIAAEKKQQKIDALVAKANEQLKNQRFTSPENDNAYITSQQLKPLAPEKAQEILTEIAQWYLQESREQMQAQSFLKNKVIDYYQRLQQVRPEHPQTQALFEELVNNLAAEVEVALEQETWQTSIIRNLMEKLREIAPNHATTKTLTQRIEQEILQEAERQMAQYKYTTPEDDNAYDTYNRLLKIFPNHPQAQSGLQEIVNQYRKLAIARKNQGRTQSARDMVERGLQIDPDNEELLDLKEELE